MKCTHGCAEGTWPHATSRYSSVSLGWWLRSWWTRSSGDCCSSCSFLILSCSSRFCFLHFARLFLNQTCNKANKFSYLQFVEKNVIYFNKNFVFKNLLCFKLFKEPIHLSYRIFLPWQPSVFDRQLTEICSTSEIHRDRANGAWGRRWKAAGLEVRRWIFQ